MNTKLVYILFLSLFAFTSCAESKYESEENKDGLVRIQASIAKNNTMTRTETEPAPDGTYYLYYTSVANPEVLTAHEFTCTTGKFTPVTPLYWDDIKKGTNTTFYLTNTESMTFNPVKSNEDVLLGMQTEWNNDLKFTLNHLMAKITVVLWDNTLQGVDFNNKKAKVQFYPGLNTKTTGIDYERKAIIYQESDKDKTTLLDEFDEGTIDYEREGFTKPYNCVTFPKVVNDHDGVYIIPQTFADTDSMEITAGKYVYRIPVPSQDDNSRTVNAGDHLTIRIELTEDIVKANATLVEWKDRPADKIEVSRVFNISNWNELKDLMQAISTGYTFKGMVVRLTQDIEVEGQICLGTEEYPFEGIFDGNGKIIRNLGIPDPFHIPDRIANKSGLFGYTRGATLQNITLEAPYVKSDGMDPVGALVNIAENTTIFNCRTKSDDTSDAGRIESTGDKVGGMVGTATGKSTLINCYSYVWVKGEGEYVGGLIGYSEASITHSFATGEVDSPKAAYVGGLVGYMTGVMQYCYAWGKVTGYSEVGGLIGYLDGKATDSYASGEVFGNKDIGGLCGNLGFDGIAEKCFWNFSSVSSGKGAGSANLSNTCKSFTETTNLLDPDYLNDPDNKIWKIENGYPVFKNM